MSATEESVVFKAPERIVPKRVCHRGWTASGYITEGRRPLGSKDLAAKLVGPEAPPDVGTVTSTDACTPQWSNEAEVCCEATRLVCMAGICTVTVGQLHALKAAAGSCPPNLAESRVIDAVLVFGNLGMPCDRWHLRSETSQAIRFRELSLRNRHGVLGQHLFTF
ncbi:uncharacterized protein EMH_0044470 [Eimeria mitis]|uniref:Uncharacterized protein n=1 Tax=Eimeria mitis TaxID=44415 RepID=U6JTT3_9EIME|nr:uncharacterized protein EMH_0044470 [Eimeria mitis]CDJ28845.1 hypothetical protein EMH_0044470 [Eimeria mitis]